MATTGIRLFIVDTDAGVDDAQAIMMFLARPDIRVLALTTVRGNTNAEQVTKNVLRLLKLAGRLDIDVYRGAVTPLVNIDQPNAHHYHGEDGFGDVPDLEPPDINLVKSEHGVNALIRLVNQYPGEISLACIAPLTNVALALRLDPDFGRKLKDCFIMGGNYHGKGNISVSAEFNFYADPEAAYVVLNELGRISTFVSWELCLECDIGESSYERFTNADSEMGRFIKAAEQRAIVRHTSVADQLLAAVAIDESIINKTRMVYCTVEMVGAVTRGQMVVDWQCTLGRPANVKLILDVNQGSFEEMMMTIVER